MGGQGEERRAGSTDQSGSRGGSENNRATSQPVYTDLTPEPPPGTIEDLPLILDRLTVQPTPVIQGRININTAPREVLLTIDGLSEDDVNAIVAARPEVPSADRATPAWLLSQNVIDLYKFRRILDKITTSSSVFRAEAVGYADNVGVIQRVNVVWEMRGPIPQVIYKRNLTGLGPAYNPYGEEIRGITD
jgi:hypothetical protein